jgi:hypothetical protein
MCFDALFAAPGMTRRAASMKFINFWIHHFLSFLNCRECFYTVQHSLSQSPQT